MFRLAVCSITSNYWLAPLALDEPAASAVGSVQPWYQPEKVTCKARGDVALPVLNQTGLPYTRQLNREHDKQYGGTCQTVRD